jgi:hypothetical protein
VANRHACLADGQSGNRCPQQRRRGVADHRRARGASVDIGAFEYLGDCSSPRASSPARALHCENTSGGGIGERIVAAAERAQGGAVGDMKLDAWLASCANQPE